MKPFNDIVAQYTDEDEGTVDLDAILEAANEEMGSIPALGGDAILSLMDQHFTYGLHYIGGLALQVAAECEALPAGFDEAYGSLLKALEFDKFRRLYEYKRNLPSKLEIV